jgi:hypothetical protein
VDGPAKNEGADGTRLVATFTVAELRWGKFVRCGARPGGPMPHRSRRRAPCNLQHLDLAAASTPTLPPNPLKPRIPFPIAAFSPTGYIDTLYLGQDLRVGAWGFGAKARGRAK